jgi:hypothetical protein
MFSHPVKTPLTIEHKELTGAPKIFGFCFKMLINKVDPLLGNPATKYKLFISILYIP